VQKEVTDYREERRVVSDEQQQKQQEGKIEVYESSIVEQGKDVKSACSGG